MLLLPLVGFTFSPTVVEKNFGLVGAEEIGITTLCQEFALCRHDRPLSSEVKQVRRARLEEYVADIWPEENIKLILHDVNARFHVSKHFYKHCSTIVLCYDVSRPETLDTCREKKKEIANLVGEPSLIMFCLVGLKSDFSKQISAVAIEKFCIEEECYHYEFSSKTMCDEHSKDGEPLPHAFFREIVQLEMEWPRRTKEILEKMRLRASVYEAILCLKKLGLFPKDIIREIAKAMIPIIQFPN